MYQSPSLLDRLVMNADQMLKTLSPKAAQPQRPTPAETATEASLNDAEKKHVAGLMRINHAGEVCAQGLYQGQALTARDPKVRKAMEHSAEEEIDHLAWCEERIHQMGSQTSVFNPLWYAMSFGLGAVAGAIGDRISLGFVAATEDQVCKHLDSHLQQLPEHDEKTRAILQQMLVDEAEHASQALAHGGIEFPAPVKGAMTLVSKVMTETTYRL